MATRRIGPAVVERKEERVERKPALCLPISDISSSTRPVPMYLSSCPTVRKERKEGREGIKEKRKKGDLAPYCCVT